MEHIPASGKFLDCGRISTDLSLCFFKGGVSGLELGKSLGSLLSETSDAGGKVIIQGRGNLGVLVSVFTIISGGV